MDQPARAALLDQLCATCIAAGEVIMGVFNRDFAVADKGDRSPVTEADTAAEAVILADLARLLPEVPVVAEEEVAAGRIPEVAGRFLLVDPLDGTKEFIARSGDFTVNVALVEAGAPTLGIVYAPAVRRLWAGDTVAGAAWTATVALDGMVAGRQALAARPAPAAGLAVVASRSHGSPATDAYLAALPVAERVSRGSSVKICLVAAGEADLYPRLAPTCEWDIAAADAVLRAAGGRLDGPDGRPMRYGKPAFHNPGFVATGGWAAPALAPFLVGD